MNTTKQEKTIKELFVGKCWEYLNDNFHKFTEGNKIKIALTLATKDIPTTLEHSGKIDGPEVRVVIVRSSADTRSDTSQPRDVISQRLEGSSQALAG